MTTDKLRQLQKKLQTENPEVVVMILGLGSVGNFLLDYLIDLNYIFCLKGLPALHIVVAGRNLVKMRTDVNIARTAATIRHQLKCEICVADQCDLENVDSVAETLEKWHPDIIVNTSRVYAGLKYGSISWVYLRAYGIWAPLATRYAKHIMEATVKCGWEPISINTSYSDAVLPWLKSAGLPTFDFGSGNLNHLVPRMKFYWQNTHGIRDLEDIDITLATAHFHDVVISKEGHSEGQEVLVAVGGRRVCGDEQCAMLKECAIPMPTDQKRNMMNASSNADIIRAVVAAITNHSREKIHTPGVSGEIGGYPFVIDGTPANVASGIDTSIFSMEDMRCANRASIYLDGIEDVSGGCLRYTSELLEKVRKVFGVSLPHEFPLTEMEKVCDLLVERIIKPNAK